MMLPRELLEEAANVTHQGYVAAMQEVHRLRSELSRAEYMNRRLQEQVEYHAKLNAQAAEVIAKVRHRRDKAKQEVLRLRSGVEEASCALMRPSELLHHESRGAEILRQLLEESASR